MSMCVGSWDGEHEYELADDEPHPDDPDDDESRVLIWVCHLCGHTRRTESWQGPP